MLSLIFQNKSYIRPVVSRASVSDSAVVKTKFFLIILQGPRSKFFEWAAIFGSVIFVKLCFVEFFVIFAKKGGGALSPPPSPSLRTVPVLLPLLATFFLSLHSFRTKSGQPLTTKTPYSFRAVTA